MCVPTEQARIFRSYRCVFVLLLQMSAYPLAWTVVILLTCGRFIGYVLFFSIAVLIFLFFFSAIYRFSCWGVIRYFCCDVVLCCVVIVCLNFHAKLPPWVQIPPENHCSPNKISEPLGTEYESIRNITTFSTAFLLPSSNCKLNTGNEATMFLFWRMEIYPIKMFSQSYCPTKCWTLNWVAVLARQPKSVHRRGGTVNDTIINGLTVVLFMVTCYSCEVLWKSACSFNIFLRK